MPEKLEENAINHYRIFVMKRLRAELFADNWNFLPTYSVEFSLAAFNFDHPLFLITTQQVNSPQVTIFLSKYRQKSIEGFLSAGFMISLTTVLALHETV